ncbi:23S rRNA (uracil(1939)-C(5))-methyltransferase RlmD [Gilvimarinus sp. SDUM040013]|uniref:23S rRNA (uracil(1939)-C(5))-methyltransferase RlmD n=1 Tax=Gilvimarinus gilvus TaxID=3058038 RepID=A0ABU4RZM8_9GAMM|nr:23S rRNA (uracil(1939)-C(5))-methyltransferase RlmD [Gilvimarinus sp. SDUM040013]MDO3386477.1 23S rRNA (uracil(1939)-C(5))-methyltransferase RlmD [Gilvimarinus sp. SDUM040013]MDX6849053.1 23S rRNA (uracil(1939)-C(5))-methyltransferase RlmD [Gilvimarinus sp. SDUM040013]
MKSRRSRRGPQRSPVANSSEIVSLDVKGYIHDGRGLAKHKGQAVFVSGALDGEQVEAKWTHRQSRYSEARTINVITPSPQRVAPYCKHFGQCGGCQLQHADSGTQLLIKHNAVLEQLTRAGVRAPSQQLKPIVMAPWHYRARARLAVKFDKAGKLSFGFRRQADSQLVNISECPVLPKTMQRLLQPLRSLLQKYDLKAVSHIELIQAEGETGVVMRHTRPIKAHAQEALQAFEREFQCKLWLSPDNQCLTTITGASTDPRLTLELECGALKLAFHPLDFTQVNCEVNQAMVDQAMRLLAPSAAETVVDLFCGIGNFTLPLAKRAGRVVGVEAIASMVARGRENAVANKLDNVEFMACDLEQHSLKSLQKRIGNFAAVLLDPPRAGALEACKQLPHTAAKRILYVSCNPSTLARDARSLTDAGFSLQSLGIMEMFPHTSHVETMALFTRG